MQVIVVLCVVLFACLLVSASDCGAVCLLVGLSKWCDVLLCARGVGLSTYQ
jgi:hypothetical protein